MTLSGQLAQCHKCHTFQISVTSLRYDFMSHCARIWPASTMSQMSHFSATKTCFSYDQCDIVTGARSAGSGTGLVKGGQDWCPF